MLVLFTGGGGGGRGWHENRQRRDKQERTNGGGGVEQCEKVEEADAKTNKKKPITIEKKTETEIKEGQRKELKWVRSW